MIWDLWSMVYDLWSLEIFYGLWSMVTYFSNLAHPWEWYSFRIWWILMTRRKQRSLSMFFILITALDNNADSGKDAPLSPSNSSAELNDGDEWREKKRSSGLNVTLNCLHSSCVDCLVCVKARGRRKQKNLIKCTKWTTSNFQHDVAEN